MTPVAWHYLALLQELSGDQWRSTKDAVGPLSNLPAAARLEGDVLEGIAGVTSLFEAFRYMDLPWRRKSETPKARAKDHTFTMPVRPSVLVYEWFTEHFPLATSRWWWLWWGGGGEQVAICASGVGMRCNWCFHVFLLRVWGLNAHEVLIWNI